MPRDRKQGIPNLAQELFEDDQKILDGTRSVCQQLGITNYNPVAVAWQALLARGRSMLEIPFDECILTGSQIILILIRMVKAYRSNTSGTTLPP